MIKVRVAPSPTGFLHIGTAQSALYNWIFARKNGGEFYLRIEDTDRERSTEEYGQSIFDALNWLGINWDGEPVIQSQNLKRHREVLEKLLSEGKAFYCHHAKEELENERNSQEKEKQAPRHICSYKNNPKGKEAGGIIRLAVNENSDRKIIFTDEIRGKVEFTASLLGDFSIARAVDDPLYHFVVVVDDADMEITHILRGEDHLSNTPKHILIYEALGFKVPVFAHLPLILAPDRSKLSKRHGDTSAIAYKKDYLPEALINFLGSMSYTFTKEIISKEEMLEEFELSKVHKSGAVFDIKKLNWINSQYIKKLSPEEFKRKISDLSIMPDYNMEIFPNSTLELITERLEKLTDIQEFNYLFVKKPDYREKLKYPKELLGEDFEKIKEILKSIKWELETRGVESLKDILEELSKKNGGRGVVYWPFRVSLTGKEKSPDPVSIARILEDVSLLINDSCGDLVLMRVNDAIEKLES